jgi:hypothetical protein
MGWDGPLAAPDHQDTKTATPNSRTTNDTTHTTKDHENTKDRDGIRTRD